MSASDPLEIKRVAFLGPAGTFSQQVVNKHFKASEPVPYKDFDETIEAVVHSDCHLGLTPFENSNSRSIVELQIALANHRGQIYITDLIPHHITHHLFSFSDIPDIQEVRSKDVVFKQTDAWLKKNLPDAKRVETYRSTAAAVESLQESGPRIAAIGSKDATDIYKVPIRANDIQTEPNITVFCALERQIPDLSKIASALIGLDDFVENDFMEMSKILLRNGCAVSADWVLKSYPHTIGVFEIGSVEEKSRLQDAIFSIERHMRKSFLVGGYSGKTITSIASGKHHRSL